MSIGLIFHCDYRLQTPLLIVGGCPALAGPSDWQKSIKVDHLFMFATEWRPREGGLEGNEHVTWIPFRDEKGVGVELSREDIMFVLRKTIGIIESGGTVAYSCYAGRNRSGMFAALYHKSRGDHDPIGLVQRAKKGSLSNEDMCKFVEDFNLEEET